MQIAGCGAESGLDLSPITNQQYRFSGGVVSQVLVKDAPDSDDEFIGNHHVYKPYRAGLPRMGPYLREFFRRREFFKEMSKSNLRAENLDTWFGRLWNILNPLLMGSVYFLLVDILSNRGAKEGFFCYLLAGLFLFSTLTQTMSDGARSITRAGKMITNTAFPRALLPFAAVRTAFSRLWPTLIVLAIICAVSGIKPSWALLACIPLLAIFSVFCFGIAMLLATLQVYFRDTRSFLPYLSRIWLYTSPVLWTTAQVPEKLKVIEVLNPMYGMVSAWSEAIVYGRWPPASSWISASVWALLTMLVGSYVFLTREREFAVRI